VTNYTTKSISHKPMSNKLGYVFSIGIVAPTRSRTSLLLRLDLGMF